MAKSRQEINRAYWQGYYAKNKDRLNKARAARQRSGKAKPTITPPIPKPATPIDTGKAKLLAAMANY